METKAERDEEKLRKVLLWINDHRWLWYKALPLVEFPKGRRMSASGCPVAKGLSIEKYQACVSVFVIEVEGIVALEGTLIPKYVVDFIREFDKGLWPELIEEA